MENTVFCSHRVYYIILYYIILYYIILYYIILYYIILYYIILYYIIPRRTINYLIRVQYRPLRAKPKTSVGCEPGTIFLNFSCVVAAEIFKDKQKEINSKIRWELGRSLYLVASTFWIIALVGSLLTKAICKLQIQKKISTVFVK